MKLATNTTTLPHISIKPNAITYYYQSNHNPSQYNNENTNIKQPQSNNKHRGLSPKARKRIQSKIQWLLTYAQPKRVYNDYSNRFFTFKINFITLTLPTLQFHTDATIKSQALNQFLTEVRQHFEVRNYVWRAECQGNGNIHFHICTDTYIPWFVVRRIWNRQLRKLGYIQAYCERFSAMDFQDYKAYCWSVGVKSLDTIMRRYNYGKKTNWKDPNTTDIHSVAKVRNLAAYLSKYMAKGSNEQSDQKEYQLKDRRIIGRLWGCSQSLSKCKSIIQLADSTMLALGDAVEKIKGCYVASEDYFSYLSADFRRLGKKWKALINRLFLEYKNVIDYVPGGIPNKKYYYNT